MNLQKNYKSEFEVAKVFFLVLKYTNSLPIRNREIDVLAWVAVNGSKDRAQMAKDLKSTVNTMNNGLSKLKKLGFLTKTYTLNPVLKQDFTNIKLGIYLGIKTEIPESNTLESGDTQK